MQKGHMWILNSPEFRTALRGGDETAIAQLKATAEGALMDFNMIFGFTGKPDAELAEGLYDFIYDAIREPETTAVSKLGTAAEPFPNYKGKEKTA